MALRAELVMPAPTGYSGTPLAQKLGIKASYRVKIRNAPSHYRALVEPLPAAATLSTRLRAPVDIYHLFCRSRRELAAALPGCLKEIRRDGAIWVSWPKKTSGVPSDLHEDGVRELALPLGLVDVKVCAVDQTWSALKLVLRKKNRS